MKRAAILMLLLAPPLAGCGGGQDNAPGGVSGDEAAALNDAAAMLDANAVSPQAAGLDNGETQ
ncbi:hypothetical protein KY084_10530 [Stakelama sp. CBK3Z-3]|uniref:Uncharacterized protein n=2 Tax=Stakelama flava TaxID=2860338 RepID=A0ABS6XM76_9SPHN|nr:hypothetical protein [Stakelama flava]